MLCVSQSGSIIQPFAESRHCLAAFGWPNPHDAALPIRSHGRDSQCVVHGPSGTSIHSREPVCRPSICHCQGPGSVGKRLSFWQADRQCRAAVSLLSIALIWTEAKLSTWPFPPSLSLFPFNPPPQTSSTHSGLHPPERTIALRTLSRLLLSFFYIYCLY